MLPSLPLLAEAVLQSLKQDQQQEQAQQQELQGLLAEAAVPPWEPQAVAAAHPWEPQPVASAVLQAGLLHLLPWGYPPAMA